VSQNSVASQIERDENFFFKKRKAKFMQSVVTYVLKNEHFIWNTKIGEIKPSKSILLHN
jgi:hypothetical protein